MNMFKKNGGFTLVELIVVIAILAILAAVAVPAYNGYITKANDAADTTALSGIKTAVLAACATEGEVKSIEVTADSTTGAVTTVKVVYGEKNTEIANIMAATDNTQIDEAYAMYMTSAVTLKGSFKAGATWTPAGGWVAG